MSTKVITGKVRASYANVFVPKAIEDGQERKYSVSLIIPKSDKKTLDKIKEAIKEASIEGKAKFGGKIPKNLKNPLRDGDEDRPDDENYENSYFINANSSRKPGVIDADSEDIIDPEEFYSGCYCRASINFFAYAVSGSKGIAAGLNHIQKLEDGEKLGGSRTSAQEDFADDDDDLL